jgi:hypothetical protein
VKPSAALDKIEEEEDDDNSNTPLSGAGNKKGSGLNLKQQMSHSSIGN